MIGRDEDGDLDAVLKTRKRAKPDEADLDDEDLIRGTHVPSTLFDQVRRRPKVVISKDYMEEIDRLHTGLED